MRKLYFFLSIKIIFFHVLMFPYEHMNSMSSFHCMHSSLLFVFFFLLFIFFSLSTYIQTSPFQNVFSAFSTHIVAMGIFNRRKKMSSSEQENCTYWHWYLWIFAKVMIEFYLRYFMFSFLLVLLVHRWAMTHSYIYGWCLMKAFFEIKLYTREKDKRRKPKESTFFNSKAFPFIKCIHFTMLRLLLVYVNRF